MSESTSTLEEIIDNLAEHYKSTDPDGSQVIDIELRVDGVGTFFIQAVDGKCHSGRESKLDKRLKSIGSVRSVFKMSKVAADDLIAGKYYLKSIKEKQITMEGPTAQVLGITNKFNIKV